MDFGSPNNSFALGEMYPLPSGLVGTQGFDDPRLWLLRDLSDLLASDSGERDTCRHLVRILARGIPADRWVVTFARPDGRLERMEDWLVGDRPEAGEGDDRAESLLPSELRARILDGREAILLSPAKLPDGESVSTLMAAPVAHEGASMGLVAAYRRKGADFSASELALVVVGGRFLAGLIQSFRLRQRLSTQNREMARALGKRTLVVEGGAMERVLERVRRVAASDSPVLLVGETGSGKERVARAIHKLSNRPGELVALNCAALPESLLESELFGHVAGAFTGAYKDKQGRFQQAHQGTLFLDEISEMAPKIQAKLLRALEEKAITPLGSTEGQPVDCRIVAATNSPLKTEVARKRFRQDLYYRLNTFMVKIPPLRERQDEIIPLGEFFLSRFAGESGPLRLTGGARTALLRHHWPGNVRELRNVIEQAAFLCDGKKIRAADLEGISGPACDLVAAEAQRNREVLTMQQVEERHLAKVLELYPGNLSQVARKLGFTRATLYNKMKRYGLKRTK